jgi:hypothetical protein
MTHVTYACVAAVLGAAAIFASVAPANGDEFQPPPEYRDQLGDFPSPLKFYDGTPVASPADWPRRREEILKRWHGIMGPWPALIERPRMETLKEERRENFTQRRVRIEIAPGQTSEGILLIPDGQPKFPAVLVPYYEPESSVGLGKEFRDYGYQLAKRGFVTLSIGSPGGDARKPEIGQARCQPLSFLAYIAANCANALANLPEVDPARIGVVGHSYGGKWAMFASCLYDRFACAVWSDLGVVWDEKNASVNYWEPWYLGLQPGAQQRKPGIPQQDNPRTGAYKVLVESGLDLHELHALMPPRPFLVSGGDVDRPSRWVALNHAVAVNRFLGFNERVAVTSRPKHAPTAEANERVYAFFERFLGK